MHQQLLRCDKLRHVSGMGKVCKSHGAVADAVRRAERGRLAMRCVQCDTGRNLQRVALPYVFRHLVTELAAMNIKCSLTVR